MISSSKISNILFQIEISSFQPVTKPRLQTIQSSDFRLQNGESAPAQTPVTLIIRLTSIILYMLYL